MKKTISMWLALGMMFVILINPIGAAGAEDASAPVLEEFSPSLGAQISGESTTLSMTFDRKVTAVAGKNITVSSATYNAVLSNIEATDVQLNETGDTEAAKTTASFNVSGLTSGERYYVLIDSGAFVGEDGQPFAGISSAETWNFQVTGSNVTLTGTIPAKNATGVTSPISIQFNFSGPVYPDNGTIRLEKSDGTKVYEFDVTSTSVTGGGTNVITVNFPAALFSGTTYKVIVSANAFKDSDGNAYPDGAADTWTFTTR